MNSALIAVAVLHCLLLGLLASPFSQQERVRRQAKNSPSNSSINAIVEGGKGAGDKVNVSHPKELVNLGTHGNMTNKLNHTLPDGRTVMRMELTIYGYPVWDGDITYVIDPTEDNQYEIVKNRYNQEMHRLADILLKTPAPWKVVSQSLCGEAWNLTEDPQLNITLTTRYLYFNKTTGTLAFLDHVVIEHNKRILFDKRCMVDASNKTVIGKHSGTHNIGYPGGNGKISQQNVDLVLPVDPNTPGNCLLQSPDGKIQIFDGTNGVPKDGSLPVWSVPCQIGPNDAANGGYGPAVDVLNNIMTTRQCLADKVPGSIDIIAIGVNGILKAYVHENSEDNKNNAAFKGGVGGVFSDGGDEYYPLVTLKTVAHEAGHGVMDKFSALIYEKESGCMNEAFADMTGLMVGVCATGSTDWTIDGDWVKGDSAGQVRDMTSAVTDSQQIKQWSDYTGKDNTEVHHCSGLYNRVFYVVATAPGWDIFKAYQLFYAANTIWSRDTTMADGACDVLRMARQLSFSVDDVNTIVSAFSGVGIQVPSDCNSIPYTSTPLQDQHIDPNTAQQAQSVQNCATYTASGSSDPGLNVVKLAVYSSASALQILLRAPAGQSIASVNTFITYNRGPAFLGDSDISGLAIDGNAMTVTVQCPQPGDYYLSMYTNMANLSFRMCAISSASNTCSS